MPSRSFSFQELESSPQSAFPVEVISLGTEVRSEESYRWNNVRHAGSAGHIFQYTLSGVGWYAWGSEPRQVRAVEPGQLFLASHDRPFEYFYRGQAPWEFMWITLRGEFADKAAQELRIPSPVWAVPLASPPASLLTQVVRTLDGPVVGDRYSLAVLAYDFLVQLLRLHREGIEDAFRRELREYLRRHLAQATVGSLSRHFGYSPKYFISLFRTKMGTTPRRYLEDQRLKYAGLLLTGTSKNLKEIATEVGYSDENYFGKAFRRHRGISPGNYREQFRGEVVDSIVLL